MLTTHSAHKEHDVAQVRSTGNIHGSHNSTSGQGYKICNFVRDFASCAGNHVVKGSGSVPRVREIRNEVFQLGTVTLNDRGTENRVIERTAGPTEGNAVLKQGDRDSGLPPGEGVKAMDGSRTRPMANNALEAVSVLTSPKSFDNEKETKSVPFLIGWSGSASPVLFSFPLKAKPVRATTPT